MPDDVLNQINNPLTHDEIWRDTRSLGRVTLEDETVLEKASIVLGSINEPDTPDFSTYVLPADTSAPEKFVVQGDIKLFGIIPTSLRSLQARSGQGTQEKIDLPQELSLSKFLIGDTDGSLDLFQLYDTSLTYKSDPIGLMGDELRLETKLNFTGALDGVKQALKAMFGQENPTIKFGCSMEVTPKWKTGRLSPRFFAFNGELSNIKASLFGLLDITAIGIEISGVRTGSKGGYELAHCFYGEAKIHDTNVSFSLRSAGKSYFISILADSDTWTNIGGITGLNVGDSSKTFTKLNCSFLNR